MQDTPSAVIRVQHAITFGSDRATLRVAALRRARKQFGRAASQPVDNKPDPFAHGRVGTPQSFAHRRERTQHIAGAARAPVDRIGLDRKARLAEHPDRARQ